MEPIDPTLPFTEITLAGVTYKMCLDFGAIAHAERLLYGFGFKDSLLLANYRLNMTTVPALFAASLLVYQPETDLLAAMKMVNWSTNLLITTKLQAAIEQFMPEDQPDAPEGGAEPQQDPPDPGL